MSRVSDAGTSQKASARLAPMPCGRLSTSTHALLSKRTGSVLAASSCRAPAQRKTRIAPSSTIVGPARMNRSSPSRCRSRTPNPPSCMKCLRSTVPSSSSGASFSVSSPTSTAISKSADQPRSTGPRKPSSRRSPRCWLRSWPRSCPIRARPSMSKPLSLPGMAMKGPKCGSPASSRTSGLFIESPRNRRARRPSAATATGVGRPSASGSIGTHASKRRLPSSVTLASRLALSVWLRSALVFLRFSPCEPTSHNQPSTTARPSMSASSSASPGRLSRSASAKLLALPKRSVSRAAEGRCSRRSMPADSSPATKSQSPLKAAPDRLVWTSVEVSNSSRTALL